MPSTLSITLTTWLALDTAPNLPSCMHCVHYQRILQDADYLLKGQAPCLECRAGDTPEGLSAQRPHYKSNLTAPLHPRP